MFLYFLATVPPGVFFLVDDSPISVPSADVVAIPWSWFSLALVMMSQIVSQKEVAIVEFLKNLIILFKWEFLCNISNILAEKLLHQKTGSVN